MSAKTLSHLSTSNSVGGDFRTIIDIETAERVQASVQMEQAKVMNAP